MKWMSLTTKNKPDFLLQMFKELPHMFYAQEIFFTWEPKIVIKKI